MLEKNEEIFVHNAFNGHINKIGVFYIRLHIKKSNGLAITTGARLTLSRSYLAPGSVLHVEYR
jgi:hypothetical protein